MDDVLVERVLRAVELVPPGRVISYGDIAALVGTGPRQVGWVLREYGSGVSWWRVVSAAGDPPKHKRETAFGFWSDEGIAIKPNGLGCRMSEYRVDLTWIATEHARATADLPR
ncbi:MGMT family protein [Janibacter sp. GS2]|uniref:MGMT family protein n=1 Tax=Janibacter sp. GS2 TaxID=3442646 RepID=UPI003EBC69E4